jgi:putative tryptophan/tyrosine transport system substrate-binding protein
MAIDIARRTFVTAFCGAAAIWPWTAVAQSGSRRIGVLMAPDAPPYVPFFIEALSKLGWTEDRNVHIDYRKSNADPASLRSAAVELLALRPDVIFAPGLSMVVARTQTQTVPIVFTQTTAPVERGFVASLARPGGNITGFTNFEPSIGGKWLGLLKEVAPKLARSATMFNSEGAPHAPFLQRSIEEASQALGITTIAAPVRTDADVDNVVASLAQDGDGALIVIPDPFTIAHRQAIIRAAATDRVPTMYSYRAFVDDGGLMGYSADIPEQYRGAANYVDRILKGAKPADLPVQAPTKYELVINLKTARAISLDIPPMLLARADEVIE